MGTNIAIGLMIFTAVLDAGLLASAPRRARLGATSPVLVLAPLGAVVWFLGSTLLRHHPPSADGWVSFLLPLALPVFAFLLGFAYLVSAFLGESRGSRGLFALHTGLAVAMGVAAITALEGLAAPGLPG